MDGGLTAKVFAYCERGLDPGFWAEPLNAVSNGGFFVAAAVAAWAMGQTAAVDPTSVDRGQSSTSSRYPEWALIGLVAIIGIGSFLFHTLASRWAAIADGAPIAIFMLAYVAYALRRYLNWPMLVVVAGLAVFVAALAAASAAPCPMALRGLVKGAGCLNGSLSYGPALVTLALVAAATTARGHPAAGYLAAAAVAFSISLTMRSLDQEVCGATTLWGQSRGTHALWHLLNAITLGLLLMAAARHGRHMSS